MLNRGGQVTIFIIIAVLIIAGVALFFVFRDKIGKKEVVSPEAASVKNFVDECLEDVSEEVIYYVGQGGGHYYPPKLSTETGITYYLINNKSYMPSKEQIENEISKYTARNLIFCLENFVSFPGYEIAKGKMVVNTEIHENELILNVEYPLTIKKGEFKTQIKDFQTEVQVRLGLVYNLTNDYIAGEDPEKGMCLTCLTDDLEIKDLFFDSLDYDNETIIFIIKDENSIINEKPFKWIFANKY